MPTSPLHGYFKSAFTVDNVIFGFDEGNLKILLITRGEAPYTGELALPGYFVREDEALHGAAQRVLHEMTGLENVYLEQLRAFGSPDRHPAGRVITVAYYSLVKVDDFTPRAAGAAASIAWYDVHGPETDRLAFDHRTILDAALDRLQRRIRNHPVGFELLPPEFTLTDLQHLYEAIWETKLEKRNFRKKIIGMNLLVDLERSQEGVAHRPAKLYRFDPARYEELMEEGFNFELREKKRPGDATKTPPARA